MGEKHRPQGMEHGVTIARIRELCVVGSLWSRGGGRDRPEAGRALEETTVATRRLHRTGGSSVEHSAFSVLRFASAWERVPGRPSVASNSRLSRALVALRIEKKKKEKKNQQKDDKGRSNSRYSGSPLSFLLLFLFTKRSRKETVKRRGSSRIQCERSEEGKLATSIEGSIDRASGPSGSAFSSRAREFR